MVRFGGGGGGGGGSGSSSSVVAAGDTIFPFLLPVYLAHTIHHTANHFVV